MREILFRGKRGENGEWVEGYCVPIGGLYYFILSGKIDITRGYPQFENIRVDPSTVGQYTGLTDKNGVDKLFEYDIIDANGRKAGNYYENSDLLEGGTYLLIEKLGTKDWSRSEQEAIKRGCKYAE